MREPYIERPPGDNPKTPGDDLHLSLQTGLVDEDGFDEIARMMCESMMHHYQEIVDECVEVAEEKGRDLRFPATLAVTAFESPRTDE